MCHSLFVILCFLAEKRKWTQLTETYVQHKPRPSWIRTNWQLCATFVKRECEIWYDHLVTTATLSLVMWFSPGGHFWRFSQGQLKIFCSRNTLFLFCIKIIFIKWQYQAFIFVSVRFKKMNSLIPSETKCFSTPPPPVNNQWTNFSIL